ncbi:MAG: hypothetical protein ABL940_07195 [Bacteroidia bacterium]
MNKKLFCILPILVLLMAIRGNAQNYWRSKKIATNTPTVLIDTLCLRSNNCAVYLRNKLLPTTYYKINAATSTITIDTAALRTTYLLQKNDSLKLFYTVYNFAGNEVFYHQRYEQSTAWLNRQGLANSYNKNYTNNNYESVYGNADLQKTGSIARGITLGNNQSLAVNSALNFQLNGELANGIKVAAAISDDNLPIQASGTTQQLQEFDKVYIQVSKDNTKLLAGDFQLASANSYFMKYNKRLQGITVKTENALNKKWTMTNEASVAISKGKFARNVVQGIEKNQGPYKLRGADNEQFIVVLSGTERVYIDGVLLLRGQDNDYVIDYNTAELTFTPKRLITKDRRIIAEFQYSDKNYVRSLLQYGGSAYTSTQKIYWNAYREQDNKNRPLQQTLNDTDKIALYNAGNNPYKAQVVRADSVAYTNTKILYEKKDSVISTTVYPNVYVYSTNETKAHYALSFSNVGQGNGNYVQDFNRVNGKVYKWITPVNGVMQGLYEPIIQLVTPKRKELYVVGTALSLPYNIAVIAEGALSNYDANTFSPYDDTRNVDWANKLNVAKKINLKDTTHILTISAAHEQQNKYFNYVERYRSVEFERDWNISNVALTNHQLIEKGELHYTHKQAESIKYGLTSFNQLTDNKGVQHKLETNINQRKLKLISSSAYTNTTNRINKTEFIRTRYTAAYMLRRLVLLSNADMEQNIFRELNTDTLLRNSYQFLDYSIGFSNNDSLKNKFKVLYNNRYDNKLNGQQLSSASIANGVTASYDWLQKQNNQLKITATYRDLQIVNNKLINLLPEKTVIGRVEHNGNFWKRLITTTTFYETGSGLEQKKEFTYVLVPAGQGTHYWNDYNKNEVQELNEFELAQYPDQQLYLKIYRVTNDYVSVYNNALSNSINLNGNALPISTSKFIRKFSNQFYTRIDKKISNNAGNNPQATYNPLYKLTTDTNLLSNAINYRNSTYYNRGVGNFGIDYTLQANSSKTLLTNGYESRALQSNILHTRYNINESFTSNVELITTTKSYLSDYLAQRNYIISSTEAEPKLTYQQNTRLQLTIGYKYTQKQTIDTVNKAKALINKGFAELRIITKNKASVNAKFNYSNIKYNAPENSPVAYEMLEALSAGNNYTWQLYWQQSINKNLQLNILYDGRKSASVDKLIHSGSVQLRAVF